VPATAQKPAVDFTSDEKFAEYLSANLTQRLSPRERAAVQSRLRWNKVPTKSRPALEKVVRDEF